MKAQAKKSLSKQIIIGFDFDKIFVDYPPLIPDQVINRLYTKPAKTITDRFPGRVEQKLRILSHYSIFRHPLWENIEQLKEIAKKQYPIYLISGRLGFLDKRTEVWLQKFPISQYFKHMYFDFENKQSRIFKNELIKKLQLTHYVDDNLNLLTYLAKENPSTQFYWLTKNTKTHQLLPANILHIKTLKDLKL